jgi:hypothetical protein
MFRASSCPSSGATTTAVTASGLPSELGDCSAVGRGRAGRQNKPLLENVLGFQLLTGLLPFVHLVKFKFFLCVLLLVLSGLVRNCC